MTKLKVQSVEDGGGGDVVEGECLSGVAVMASEELGGVMLTADVKVASSSGLLTATERTVGGDSLLRFTLRRHSRW